MARQTGSREVGGPGGGGGGGGARMLDREAADEAEEPKPCDVPLGDATGCGTGRD